MTILLQTSWTWPSISQHTHVGLKCCRCCSCLFAVINTGPVYQSWVHFDNELTPDELTRLTVLGSPDLLFSCGLTFHWLKCFSNPETCIWPDPLFIYSKAVSSAENYWNSEVIFFAPSGDKFSFSCNPATSSYKCGLVSHLLWIVEPL